MSEVEEWGVKNVEGIYILTEGSAREVAESNKAQTLVCKINGEWVRAK